MMRIVVGLFLGLAFIFFVVVFLCFSRRNHFKIVSKLYREVSNLEKKLDSAVKYSNADVKLLKSKLAEFELIGNSGEGVVRLSTAAAKRISFRKSLNKKDLSGNAKTLSNIRFRSSDVELGDLIGKGGFGEVFKGEFHGQDVAVKTLKVVDEENLGRFREEVLLMTSLHHTNIVFLLGMCWDESLIGLLMEFSDKGSLTDVLVKSQDFTWVDPLLKYVSDVAHGLQYLHNVKWYDYNTKTTRESIIHRDIKTDNVLVFSPDTCKLSDFGMSRAIDLDSTMTAVGTAIYIAPEIARGDFYSLAADIFSFGMLVFACALKNKPVSLYIRECYAKEHKRSLRVSEGYYIHLYFSIIHLSNTLSLSSCAPSPPTS